MGGAGGGGMGGGGDAGMGGGVVVVYIIYCTSSRIYGVARMVKTSTNSVLN